jgi:asparagine synthetase B (glutamine-hydrolysing)
MTLRGVDVVRSKALVRLPFTDNDLVEFSLRIPPGLRHDRRLVQHAFMKAHPELSHIPISWTGMPMQSNSRDLMMRARNMLQWHLYKYGLSKQRAIPWKPYKDYHNWFRGMLRPWMEGLLLSDRFMQRNYYQPESVRSMVSQHMAGKNQTVRLGAMLAIEIWHRLFID